MATDTAVMVADDSAESERKRKLALLKAVGLDRVAPEQRELALAIAKRYDLDLLLKHLVLIDGKPYITRDGLLWVAHRSKELDGITVTRPVIEGDYWYSEATVYRKDMSHPFIYGGRYPVKGKNTAYGPEMSTKVAECMALRRAFNVSAPSAEERWDVEVPVSEPEPPKTLAEKAAEKAAAIDPKDDSTKAIGTTPPTKPEAQPDLVAAAEAVFEGEIVESEPKLVRCPAIPEEGNLLELTEQCAKAEGHDGAHKSRQGSWPATPVNAA